MNTDLTKNDLLTRDQQHFEKKWKNTEIFKLLYTLSKNLYGFKQIIFK